MENLRPRPPPQHALDGLNFFLADVRDGLGPYLAIYLLAVHQWQPASIGQVMTLASIATAAFFLVLLALPETHPRANGASMPPPTPAGH